MSAHTPGPWVVGTPTKGRMFRVEDAIEIQSGYKSMVAVLPAQNASADGARDRANARLIAAAPELMAAVTDEIDRCPLCSEGAFCRTPGHDSMRAAIAKAEGRL